MSAIRTGYHLTTIEAMPSISENGLVPYDPPSHLRTYMREELAREGYPQKIIWMWQDRPRGSDLVGMVIDRYLGRKSTHIILLKASYPESACAMKTKTGNKLTWSHDGELIHANDSKMVSHRRRSMDLVLEPILPANIVRLADFDLLKWMNGKLPSDWTGESTLDWQHVTLLQWADGRLETMMPIVPSIDEAWNTLHDKGLICRTLDDAGRIVSRSISLTGQGRDALADAELSGVTHGTLHSLDAQPEPGRAMANTTARQSRRLPTRASENQRQARLLCPDDGGAEGRTRKRWSPRSKRRSNWPSTSKRRTRCEKTPLPFSASNSQRMPNEHHYRHPSPL